jgi:mRNA-degrading endonuclease toxin of MazEF toxin-antitoxin module
VVVVAEVLAVLADIKLDSAVLAFLTQYQAIVLGMHLVVKDQDQQYNMHSVAAADQVEQLHQNSGMTQRKEQAAVAEAV